MSEIPPDLLYTEDHEYLKATGEAGVYEVGITAYAQGELGDIVFVELPSVGEAFERAAAFGTVEAVKAVSDLYMPVSGEVVEVNQALDQDPALVNRDPYGAGWMVKVRITDPDQLDMLLGAEEYRTQLGES